MALLKKECRNSYLYNRMRSLAVASRPRLSECIHSIIYDIVGRTYVMVPLVRNVDGERSEGCCHLANG